MIEYLLRRPDRIITPLLQHIHITIVSLVISLVLATLLTIISVRFKKVGYILNQVFAVIYSIPSLALFAILMPFTGLGFKSAVIVLVLYNQYLLLRNFLTGLDEVDSSIKEAAIGIGMTPMQLLFKVQVPLARTALYAGIRMAIVSTIGIATIAASINAGGIGDLLFDGLRTMNINKIMWGTILSAGLTIIVNALLRLIERKSEKHLQAVKK